MRFLAVQKVVTMHPLFTELQQQQQQTGWNETLSWTDFWGEKTLWQGVSNEQKYL